MWYSKQFTMPLSYLIGIPLGWLLLGTFQYFVCIVILGDSFLDPWYFTCAWIVEVISTLPVIMIITIIKCLYVQVVSVQNFFMHSNYYLGIKHTICCVK